MEQQMQLSIPNYQPITQVLSNTYESLPGFWDIKNAAVDVYSSFYNSKAFLPVSSAVSGAMIAGAPGALAAGLAGAVDEIAISYGYTSKAYVAPTVLCGISAYKTIVKLSSFLSDTIKQIEAQAEESMNETIKANDFSNSEEYQELNALREKLQSEKTTTWQTSSDVRLAIQDELHNIKHYEKLRESFNEKLVDATSKHSLSQHETSAKWGAMYEAQRYVEGTREHIDHLLKVIRQDDNDIAKLKDKLEWTWDEEYTKIKETIQYLTKTNHSRKDHIELLQNHENFLKGEKIKATNEWLNAQFLEKQNAKFITELKETLEYDIERTIQWHREGMAHNIKALDNLTALRKVNAKIKVAEASYTNPAPFDPMHYIGVEVAKMFGFDEQYADMFLGMYRTASK
ncbi:hypothetical protein RFI_01470, partial [Reticulomyxa filosa]